VRLYRLLLRLFPASFRARFDDDMADVFRDRLARARAAGPHAVVALWLSTLADLARHGLAERRLMRGVIQDLRYALRAIRRQPGLAAAALVTLALGIGANTAIFSVVHAVLIRPLPYPHADAIVQLYATHRAPDFTRGVLNPFDLDLIERRTTTFEALSPLRFGSATLTNAGDPARLRMLSVMPSFFDVMRTPPALGGVFTPDQARTGAQVVVISHRLWTERLQRRADIAGATLLLDDVPWTVVGVMPETFAYPADIDLWRPLVLTAKDRADMGSWYLGAIARLKPGAPIETAQAELDGFAADLAAAYPKQRGNRGFSLIGLQEDLAFRSADGLRLLQGVVVVVLLIACANVANLRLAEMQSRRRELGVRAAIGASRRRLVRQLLTESLVLAAGGAAIGTAVAVWGVRALVALAPPYVLPDPDSIGVSGAALAFTAALAGVTAALFGVAPALLAAPPPVAALDGARTASAGLALARRQRLRSALVAVEVALALVLVAGAGLLVRSFVLLMRQPTGIDADRVLTAQLTLPAARYGSDEARSRFWRDVVDRLGTLPGVVHAAGSTALPYSLWEWQSAFVVEGLEHVPNNGAGIRTVTPDLFATIGVPVLLGRSFTAADTADAERVVIVSDAFVRRHLDGAPPLGRRLASNRARPEWATIVGVVGSTRHRDLTEDLRPEIYYPLAQTTAPSTFLFAVRTAGDPAAVAPLLRSTIAALDPGLPVLDVSTMAALVDAKLAVPRFTMGLLGLFAALAVALAATGVYGVMSYVVGQGRREIGIRLALGARAWRVQRRVVGQGLAVVTAGAIAGITGAYWLTTLLESELFLITPHDPWTFAAAAAALFGIAALACWLPAARVSRVDPASVLRAE
jgi:putative ABC transport system permease protein